MMNNQTTDTAFKRACVLGWPVGHSLSPRLHKFWLNHYAIDGDYVPVAVEPKNFDAALRNLQADGFIGCNVTVPHKETAFTLLSQEGEVSAEAQHIGAVNSVKVQNNGTLYGFNTDGFGFVENLSAGAPGFDFTKGPAVVLGAGGAARAVIVALLNAGVPEVRLLNRTRARAEELQAKYTDMTAAQVNVGDWDARADQLEGAHLLVNTTALGMTGKAPLEIDLAALPKSALVTDIVYSPLETDLLASARLRGNATVDGLGMLLHQARPGFEAWFGLLPDVTDELRAWVLAGMD